jgi:hypothetical protein
VLFDQDDYVVDKQQTVHPRWALSEEKPAWLGSVSEKDAINFLCVLLNTASTVCIVFANKV